MTSTTATNNNNNNNGVVVGGATTGDTNSLSSSSYTGKDSSSTSRGGGGLGNGGGSSGNGRNNNGPGLGDSSTTSDPSATGSAVAAAVGGRAEGLAAKESQRVFRNKLLVIIVLMISATSVAIAAFFFTKSEEQNDLESRFIYFATKLLHNAEGRMNGFIESLESLSFSLTGYAMAAQIEWPFVTLPDFHIHGSFVLEQLQTDWVSFITIVKEIERTKWEQYTMTEIDWIYYNPVEQEEDEDATNTTTTTMNTNFTSLLSPVIFPLPTTSLPNNNNNNNGTSSSSSSSTIPSDFLYFPVRQIEPGGNNLAYLNFDSILHPGIRPLYQSIMEHPHPTISDFANFPQENISNYNDDANWPRSFLSLPIFDHIDDYHVHNNNNNNNNNNSDSSRENNNVVGFLNVFLLWHTLFDNVLSDTVPGIYLVLENTERMNGQESTCTYRIDGKTITFLGEGDLHDTTFDHLAFTSTSIFIPNSQQKHQSTANTNTNTSTTTTTTTKTTTTTFIETFHCHQNCSHVMTLYPTTDFVNVYSTNQAIIFIVGIYCIFLITAIVFVSYDCAVERRQNKVLMAAKKSDAIVSSFFPSQVRDRLMDGDDDINDIDARISGLNHPSSNDHDGGGGLLSSNNHFRNSILSPKNGLRRDSSGGTSSRRGSASTTTTSKPIADLYPHATVMFADIANFTAWSSVREPSHVFTLLETVYSSFDRLARHRGVFKVETIGDCYVAVVGLPEPRQDHAIVMARFARECVKKMNELVLQLEMFLGPGTADLCIRCGLHSGPVTAGVLRGEKSRFQLFGDTVEIAARMENTGEKNNVHLSQETADLIIDAGKKHWIKKRKRMVEFNGKGQIQTYWLHNASTSSTTNTTSGTGGGGGTSGTGCGGGGGNTSITTASTNAATANSTISHNNNNNNNEYIDGSNKTETRTGRDNGQMVFPGLRRMASSCLVSTKNSPIIEDENKQERLIGWHVDVLRRLIKKIVASQCSYNKYKNDKFRRSRIDSKELKLQDLAITTEPGMTVLDEVKEIITMSNDANDRRDDIDPAEVILEPHVESQLRHYVRSIANMYRYNHFHNFEHASHVAQSVTKLLSRVVTPDSIDYGDMRYKRMKSTDLHKFTFGLTSDPLIEFSCVFSALIHDVDHPGVPNAVLVAEKQEIALTYKNKSVAEQNSVDIAWELLMEAQYDDLRRAIFGNKGDLTHFRQLIVNSVMATDVVDKELGMLRKKRWAKAFSSGNGKGNDGSDRDGSVEPSTGLAPETPEDSINRKATIVIEHIIQAADVAHTMQHWHVYVKWNERFFREMYQAYLDGRSKTDPSISWYDGELGFFDFYIIPLAKKLESCGVFGVSSDECLNYANANRSEWERKGRGLVQHYLNYFNDTELSSSSDQEDDEVGREKEPLIQ